MSALQKVIKYLAVAFGAFLILVIFSTIIGVGMMFGRLVGSNGDDLGADWSAVESVGGFDENVQIAELDIKIKATNLRIERGEKLEILSDNSEIKVKQDGDVLKIAEDGDWWGWGDHGYWLKVRLPEGMSLARFRLEAGAGKVELDGLRTKDLNLNLGAGPVDLRNIIATNSAKVDGGAGHLSLQDSELNNLDLDMGAGKVEVGAKLTGKADVDAGVGHLTLNLRGNREDYRIKVDKGIGSVRLNGEKIDGSTYGDGETEIDIDGGVGAIEINTER